MITSVAILVTVTTICANIATMFGITFRIPATTEAATITPILTGTPSLVFNLISAATATIPSATETSMPTSTLNSTPTSTNTLTNTPPIPATSLLVDLDCFDRSKWTPYEIDIFVSKQNGCWNLRAWGFTARENEVIVVAPDSAKGEFHGIYTPIKDNSEISFKIRVDRFNVDPGVTANIGIGIISLDPLGPSKSRLVFYHYIPKDSESYIPMKTGVDAGYKDLIPLTLKFSSPQKVTIRVEGPFLTMIFDDKTKEELTIPFEKRAFWISYSIPPSSELIMSIYDLEIK